MSSLRPAHIVLNPYFYPAGNSPAVCLTQDVPPERDAALLLLGCGDIRNILFTIYSGSGTDDRRLDFTCCDLEAEIIARNALLLTSILDDPTGDHTQQLWNIYYHNFLDSASASLLQTQAAKLVAQAQSPEAWETGSYAQFVEFGDSTTFAKVLELWKIYATLPADKKQHIQLQAELRAQWRAAKKWQEIKVEPHSLQLTGGRSFAPVLQEAPAELNKTYRTYWRTGTCLENEEMTSQLTIANPMFMCLRDGLQLHYGTSPLLGFHHAAAYTRLSTESPLKTSEADIKEMPKPMASALTQFSEWCKAFRLTATRVKVRYVYSEAIAFCHVLRHQRLHGGARSANWYRNNWGYGRLELGATCYGPRGNAPTAFDVIDTSNLTDHLGILNVLAAAGPLLVSRLAATIRTEVFIPPETTASESAKALLSGDLPTVALLLGLKPVHFWSDATASWHVNDSIELDSIHAAAMVSSMSRQIILWGPTETNRVEWIAPSLAEFVFRMYHSMFQNENLHSLLGFLNTGSEGMLARKLHTYEMYSRASLAVILLHIKNSGVVEWRPFIEGFLDMVIQDRTLMLEQLHYVCPDVLPILHIDTKGPHAVWLKWLTSGNATMSGAERNLSRKLQKRGEALLGRTGVKDRIFKMISEFADLNSTARCSVFRIEDTHGFVAIVMVHAIRMDLSNQTVFLDAAVIPMLNTLPKECRAAVEEIADTDMVTLKVSDQEALFWKHLLPAFAERCRQWQHMPPCEYTQQDMVPIYTVPGESSMCRCGLGVFPGGYLEGLEAFKSLARFSVRVAIPVIFPSPVSRDSTAPGLPANINEPSHPKQDCCNVCSARKSSDGKPLQKCAGCKVTLYCSSACQKKNWKKGHKQMCSQLKEG
ncbi:hypothetical protein J4E89_005300 [Alternaria sp. Ai002NY15]|nr:hypothetical protein J4E89_005300 [Alternaria sp. Ai002NY15]